MRKRSLFLVIAVAALAFAGCNSVEKGESFSKTEGDKFKAPLGQPMPPEAKAAMEKATREAASKAAPK